MIGQLRDVGIGDVCIQTRACSSSLTTNLTLWTQCSSLCLDSLPRPWIAHLCTKSRVLPFIVKVFCIYFVCRVIHSDLTFILSRITKRNSRHGNHHGPCRFLSEIEFCAFSTNGRCLQFDSGSGSCTSWRPYLPCPHSYLFADPKHPQ